MTFICMQTVSRYVPEPIVLLFSFIWVVFGALLGWFKDLPPATLLEY